MIRLVASDIDGTLLVEGTNQLNPALYDVIRALKEKGVSFAAASGRQYSSIRRLFAPVKDDIFFIAENGSYVVYQDIPIQQVIMNREQCEKLIREIRAMDGCELTVASFDCMYVETKDEQFIDWLVNGYRNDIEVVDDVLARDVPINKISIYKRSGVDDIADEVIGRWKGTFKSVVAGAVWIDFMDYRADKGNALRMLQRLYGVAPDETMAFGDNENDLGMLAAAGESYAVGNARESVKKKGEAHRGREHQRRGVKGAGGAACAPGRVGFEGLNTIVSTLFKRAMHVFCRALSCAVAAANLRLRRRKGENCFVTFCLAIVYLSRNCPEILSVFRAFIFLIC